MASLIPLNNRMKKVVFILPFPILKVYTSHNKEALKFKQLLVFDKIKISTYHKEDIYYF